MTEEADTTLNTSSQYADDNVTPKKKKRRSSGKFSISKSLADANQVDQSPVPTPCTFQFNFLTPDIEKSKSESVNRRCDQSENDNSEGIRENGIGYPSEEHPDTEGYNTSVVEDGVSDATPKKKKKKKRKDTEKSLDIAENDFDEGNVSLNCSAIEEGECEMSHSTKKKKKKVQFDESFGQAQEENGYVESNNSSAIDDESLETPHKKKKKKKREDLEESFEQTFDADETLEDGSEVTPHKKKKKKRKREDSENVSLTEEMDADELETTMEDGTPNVKRKGKKKHEVDSETEQNERLRDPEYSRPNREMEAEMSRPLDNTMEEDYNEQGKRKNMEENYDERGERENMRFDEVDEDAFTKIERVKGIRKSKVDRVLPEWLSNPTRVSMNLTDGLPLKSLTGIDSHFLKRLNHENIKQFFPIQVAVIPELIASSKSISMRYRPRDVCVAAPTGSGKTLSYVLPILQALKGRVVPRLRALVILPTQELAKQVFSVFESYTKLLNLKICLAIGSQNLKKEQDALVYRDSIGDCSVDVLVATLGRLSDHVNYTKGLNFKYLRFLVLDEADLFLSSSGGSMMLKLEALKKKIHRPVPDNSIICGGFQQRERLRLPEPYLQQILISATLMHDPEQLKVLDLYRPKLFIAANEAGETGKSGMVVPYMRPQELREEFVVTDPNLKPLVLHYLIHTHKLTRVLIFTKSTMATHTLSIVLAAMSKGYTVAKFSSKEKNRKEILKGFTSGKIDVLISSDAMARGLDITDVNQVVSYDVPSVQTYVHRIGRTGRAGKQGFALSLVEDTSESQRNFKAIQSSGKESLIRVKVSEKALKSFETNFEKALVTLKETLRKEKRIQREKKTKSVIEKAQKSKEEKKLLKKHAT